MPATLEAPAPVTTISPRTGQKRVTVPDAPKPEAAAAPAHYPFERGASNIEVASRPEHPG